jgi:hypothetical protein
MSAYSRKSVRWIFVAAGLLGISACHVALLSDYDDVFDQEATSAQKDVDALYQKIIGNPNAQHPDITAETYVADRESYANIRAELDGLKVRAQAHDHNENTFKTVDAIAHSFSVVEDEHKRNPELHIEAAKGELTMLNQQFTALIRQELLKKQGGGEGK